MLPRPTRQVDDEEWEVEQWYGKPQHETDRPSSEQELYGDPQHDVPNERSPSDFDLDLGYTVQWISSLPDDDSKRQLLVTTER